MSREAIIETLRKELKKYKLLYKTTKKDLEDLVKRTPSKFLSKDSDYSKPDWTPKQMEYWDKMIKESIEQTKEAWKKPKRSDKWRIEQFNRHRNVEEQVKTIEDMNDKVSELFDRKYIYESPDGGKTLYRREFGKSDREKVNE